MLAEEDADEVMAEFMDELQRKVMDRCYEMDIERQVKLKSYQLIN